MSRECFDWKTIEEDIVVPEQAAIAVYNNPAGGIVLRQAGQYGPDEDTTIVLDPSHAMALARALLDRAGLDMAIVHVSRIIPKATADLVDDTDASDQIADTKPDKTAAERQRRRRQKQRQRDSVTEGVTERDTYRDSVTAAPLVPEFDLQNGGPHKALAN